MSQKLKLFLLFLFLHAATIQAQEGEWVRLIPKAEFLQNFYKLSRAELVLNYARHYPSANYSANFTEPTDITSQLKIENGKAFLPEGAFYSQRIFGTQFLLWDRTALAIMSIQAFVNNDSQWLSEAQRQVKMPAAIQLDKQAGAAIQKEMQSRLAQLGDGGSPEQMLKSLDLVLTYLAIHDSTKTHPKQPDNPFLNKLKADGVSNSTEHDRVLKDVLDKTPQKFPELANLDTQQMEALKESVRSLFNLGHFIQGEGTTGSYQSSLEAIVKSTSPKTWSLYLAHILPDMAGVAPLPGMNGTLIITKPKAKRYEYALKALATMSEHGNAAKATNAYFDLLIANEYKELGSLSRERQLLLVQLAEHMEAYTPAKLSELRVALSKMKPELRNSLIREKVHFQGLLDPKQGANGAEILLQQAPKVLKGKNRTLVQSLELLANVFDSARDGINKGTVKIDPESKTVLIELDGLIDAKHGEFWDVGEIKNGQGKLLVGIEETSAACLR